MSLTDRAFQKLHTYFTYVFAIGTYTRATQNVSTGKRMDRDLSEAAVTCVVALKIARGSNCLIESLHVLKMQVRRGFFDLETWTSVVFGYLNIIYLLVKPQHPSAQVMFIVE